MANHPALLNFVRIGSGEPLIILHGLFGSSKNWHSLTQVFSRYYDVLALDLRNHGLSFHDDVMDYPAMVDDVYRLLCHLDIHCCRLIGHSMGGKVGMLLALRHPQLLSRLVVADIAPVAYTHGYEHLIEPVMALNLDEMESRSAVDRALQNDIADPKLRHFLLQSLVRDADRWRWKNNWAALKQNIDKITGFPEPAQQHENGAPVNGQINDWRVSTTTLFINGGQSDYVDQKAKAVIRQHFDAAEFKTLANAGHWLHAEQPQQFAQAVLEFL